MNGHRAFLGNDENILKSTVATVSLERCTQNTSEVVSSQLCESPRNH